MQQFPSDDMPPLPAGLVAGWADPGDALDDTQLWLRWDVDEICHVRLLSADILHYWGHWVPAVRAYRRCTTPQCQFCGARRAAQSQTRNLASERRVRYLVSVQRHSGALAVWEFGDAVARQLQQITGYRVDAAGVVQRDVDLRGLELSLCREGARQAGAVVVAPARGVTWPDGMPEPLPLGAIMAELWRRAALHDGKGQPRLPVIF